MSLTHLRHLQESQLALVLDQGASLHVCPGLLGDLHEELLAACEALAQDVQVHCGPDIIHVGDEAELLPLLYKAVQQATAGEGLVEISVSWRIPLVRYRF